LCGETKQACASTVILGIGCLHSGFQILSNICIDGTFLTGKYKGTIQTAMATDSNNQLLSLVIAFVEGENGDSWYWFLKRLKNMVVKDFLVTSNN
jgi:hypothetical protein